MFEDDPPINVLPFRRPGQPRGAVPPSPAPPPDLGEWPRFSIESEEPPVDLPQWVEDETTHLAVAAKRFQRALRLLGTIDLATVGAWVDDFRGATRRLIRTIEVLRLRRLRPQEVRPLVEGIRAAAGRLRDSRRLILAALDDHTRRQLLLREARTHVTLRCLDDTIAARARRRQVATSGGKQALRVGGAALPAPSEDALAARTRRRWRADRDRAPIDPEGALSQLIPALPEPWLAAMLLQLGGHPAPSDAPAAGAEEVVALLSSPRALWEVVRALPFGARRILEATLSMGGVCRYDHLTHLFGPDDETAWYWLLDPPRADLERLRRTGLLLSGTAELEGQARRVAVIPAELRPVLLGLLDEHPPPPVSLRGRSSARR